MIEPVQQVLGVETVDLCLSHTSVVHAIVILPKSGDVSHIEELRRQFDPLAGVIGAHITLVFPFSSDLTSDQLGAHIQQVVRGMGPFEVDLAEVTGYRDEYLFLNVKRGNDLLIDLHDRLYTGPLAKHRSREHIFVPHMTLGRLPTPAAFRHALDVARKTCPSVRLAVTELYVCRVPDIGPACSGVPQGFAYE